MAWLSSSNRTLLDKDFKKADEITKQIKAEFINNPNWKTNEKELRDLRKGTYYAVLNEEENIDKAAAIVEDLFNQLFKAYNLWLWVNGTINQNSKRE